MSYSFPIMENLINYTPNTDEVFVELVLDREGLQVMIDAAAIAVEQTEKQCYYQMYEGLKEQYDRFYSDVDL